MAEDIKDQSSEDLIEFEWGGEDDYNEINAVFDHNYDDPFEEIRKLGWEDVMSMEDTRPRELMEDVETLMNLGARLYVRGVKKVRMVNCAMNIWIKVIEERPINPIRLI